MIAQDTWDGNQGRGTRRLSIGGGVPKWRAGTAGHMKERREHGGPASQGSGPQAACPAMSRKPYQAPDHELWVEVARTLKPLGKRVRRGAEAAKPAVKTNTKYRRQSSRVRIVTLARPERFGPPQLSGFDRRTSQRLMRKVRRRSRRASICMAPASKLRAIASSVFQSVARRGPSPRSYDHRQGCISPLPCHTLAGGTFPRA